MNHETDDHETDDVPRFEDPLSEREWLRQEHAMRRERLHLDPGETKHLTFHLDPRTLSMVDEKGTRAVTAGEYKLSLGSSQPGGDLGSTSISSTFTITGLQQLPH